MVRHNRQPFAFWINLFGSVMCSPHFSFFHQVVTATAAAAVLSLSMSVLLLMRCLSSNGVCLCVSARALSFFLCVWCSFFGRRRLGEWFGRCYSNHWFFLCVLRSLSFVLSVKKTFKGLRRTSWHTTKETTERRRCGREKMYYFGGGYCCSIYIFCTFIGRAIYLAAAVALFLSLVLLFAMDIHRINAHDSLFFLYPEWASQWDSAYNHHFEAYVCFLSNRISPHSLARTHSPAHLSYSHHSHCNLLFTDFSFFCHIMGFAVFFPSSFFYCRWQTCDLFSKWDCFPHFWLASNKYAYSKWRSFFTT